jgi:protein SCO1/2
LKIFGKDVIGLTASSINDENLKDCMKKYKIYANKVSTQNGNYNVDHTTMVYLIDTHSKYLGHINPSLTEKQSAMNLM